MSEDRHEDLNETVRALRDQLAQRDERTASLETLLDETNRRLAEQQRMMSAMIQREAVTSGASPDDPPSAEAAPKDTREITARFGRDRLRRQHNRLAAVRRGQGALRTVALWTALLAACFFVGAIFVPPLLHSATRDKKDSTPALKIAQPPAQVARLPESKHPREDVEPGVALVPSDSQDGISLTPVTDHPRRRTVKKEKRALPDSIAKPVPSVDKRQSDDSERDRAANNETGEKPKDKRQIADARAARDPAIVKPRPAHPQVAVLSEPARPMSHRAEETARTDAQKPTAQTESPHHTHDPDLHEPIVQAPNDRTEAAASRRETARRESVQVPDDIDTRHSRRDEERDDPKKRVTVRICVDSGMLANPWCPHTAMLNVAPTRAPVRRCRWHHAPLDGWD